MQDSFRRYYVLGVTTLAFVALGLSLLSYPTISTIVSRDFELSNTESGLLTSSFALTYTIMQLPAGFLADRIGGAKSLLLALSITTMGPLLFLFGGNFGSALVSRAIAGAGAGMILPSSVRLLTAAFPKRELDRAMGILGTGWGASQTLAYALLPLLILGQDWHPPLEFTIVFAFLVTIMAIPPIRHSAPGITRVARASISVRGLLTKSLFVLVLANFTSLVVSVGMLAWMPSFMTENLRLTPVDSGRLIATVGMVGIASSFAGGVMSQRIGPRIVVLGSMVLLVIAPVLVATSNSALSALLAVILLGVGGNIYFGPIMALVPYSSRQGLEAAGISFGIFNTLSNVGNFIAPIVVGYALDLTGSYLVAFTALSVIAVSGVAGALMIRTSRAAGVAPGA
jgi:MFS transporter, ACS family, aldohexuronate transporter